MSKVRDADGDTWESRPGDLLWTCRTQDMDQVCAEALLDFGPLTVLP